uniref:Cytochrome c oxidase subunit 2 n=1 Tax=Trigonopterus selaruensis TaxID=2678945 RepID=A0A7H1KHQ3_9CUCU|nr:cytochrome c oxidase subunit II [Trigonopterus selaruensis]QNT26819.1 cytochrome c oxidase subunit 2 [Trigonopterus selaruensis]
MATWKTLLLQDSASPVMEQLTFFHDHTLLILIAITVMVSQMMVTMFFNKFTYRFLLQGQLIETIWTIIPAVILILIALPSLRLLYIMDEIFNPISTIKIIGHQWYWSYEYSDYTNLEFDSYMIPSKNLKPFNFRLLEVDNRMVVPFNSQIRIIVTSLDVIHSWAVPALGVKIDGTPGRLNQASFNVNRTGLFYGQCSEICGANHSFMPIVVESISPKYFLEWINSVN